MDVALGRISVVICTKDRAAGLERTLKHWAKLFGDPGLDMIVVDDGSKDQTPLVVARAGSGFRGRFQAARTVGVGLGAARNAGWRMAAGDIVLFTDDDCYPADDLPTAIRSCFADSDISFIGGQLLPATPAHAGVAAVTRSFRVEIGGPSFVPAGLIPGANMAIRRAALEQVGGFDPEFGAGTPFPAEDVEVIARLAAAGLRGAYDPRPQVVHDHDRLTEPAQRRLRYQYSRGRGAYYAKCLLNPALRRSYLTAWARSATRSIPHTVAELGGAIRYWLRRPSPGRS